MTVIAMEKQAVGGGVAAVREGATRQRVAPRLWTAGERAVRSERRRSCPNRAVLPIPLLRASAVRECGSDASGDNDAAFHRKRTEALLRRYQRLRMGMGRVPTRMDMEGRGRVSHRVVHGFDDAVIFCTDVERCLGRLNAEDQRLLERIAVQEYTMGEAAGLLGMSLRKCIVMYRRALDRGTRLLIDARLLEVQ